MNLKEYSAIANSTREVVEHFYLPLLGAKVARLDPPHREAFVRDARRALPLVDVATIDTLLRIGEGWRTAMMGSWWAAPRGHRTPREQMRARPRDWSGRDRALRAIARWIGDNCVRDSRSSQDLTEPRFDGSGVPAEKLGRLHSAVGSTRITVPTRSMVLSKEATRKIPVLSAQATR